MSDRPTTRAEQAAAEQLAKIRHDLAPMLAAQGRAMREQLQPFAEASRRAGVFIGTVFR